MSDIYGQRHFMLSVTNKLFMLNVILLNDIYCIIASFNAMYGKTLGFPVVIVPYYES